MDDSIRFPEMSCFIAIFKEKNGEIWVQPVTSTIQRQNDAILRHCFDYEFHL